jgi:hypothetical protein
MTKDEKGLAFSKAYGIALKCPVSKNSKKISYPPLGSYLVYEPNFWLIK